MASQGFGASDLNLRRDDVIIKGPAGEVRRVLILARKLDRLRRQVRINLRMAEMNDTASRNLGLTWNFGTASGSTTTVAEIPDPTLANLLSGSTSTTAQQLIGVNRQKY